MKKTGLLILILMLALLLVGCGETTDLPDGMQLVRGGEDIGYYFYAPEEWTVANHQNISVAYASKIDTTSATLTEAKMPEGSFVEYFKASFEGSAIAPDIKLLGEACSFGNAEEAYKFIYDFKYENGDMRCMQILAVYDGRFYIFTFTSQLAERTEGESYYDFYLAKVQDILKNVKFVSQIQSNNTKEYPKDADGYSMVTDKSICDFDFYIPDNWNVRYSNNSLGISTYGGASLNVSEASGASGSVESYHNLRIDEIEALFGNVTEIKNGALEMSGTAWAYYYEYSYEYHGTTWQVYQVILLTDFPSAVYTITYTAPASVYSEHYADVEKMISKVNFD